MKSTFLSLGPNHPVYSVLSEKGGLLTNEISLISEKSTSLVQEIDLLIQNTLDDAIKE